MLVSSKWITWLSFRETARRCVIFRNVLQQLGHCHAKIAHTVVQNIHCPDTFHIKFHPCFLFRSGWQHVLMNRTHCRMCFIVSAWRDFSDWNDVQSSLKSSTIECFMDGIWLVVIMLWSVVIVVSSLFLKCSHKWRKLLQFFCVLNLYLTLPMEMTHKNFPTKYLIR